ncbi:MAG: PorP/SprF family type IX secretion system membrane protein [Bacteroidia bacterium]|nr:PorP/SprF family type IX secretion system membrane protein [Bacteroidia bacterium]
MKFRYFLILFLLCSYPVLKGQDIHFSQYNGSLLNLNPAFTGLFDGDYRFNGIYRSQWQSVPVPYKTFGFAADMRYRPEKLKSDCIGIGLQFNNDQAGDAFYTTNQIYLSGSFIHKLKKDSALLVSVGLNTGYSSSNFNYNKMSFDNQFDGYDYDNNSPTGENFGRFKTGFTDFNVGVAFQYSFSQFMRLTYAFSFNHLTNPSVTYQGNTLSKLDSKLGNYIGFELPVTDNNKFIAQAEILYSHQGKYNEFVPGANIKYMMNTETNNGVSLGFYLRTRDAFITRLGYTFKTTTAGMSYDLNTSKFIAATNRRGAFEIFITHIIKRNRPFIAKKRVCPVFM